jgi:hypothetical protein
MISVRTGLVAGLLVAAGSTCVQAQMPDLQLSSEQRQTIYQSLSQGMTADAPAGFQAAIGAQLPDSLKLEPMSDTLSKLIPNAQGYQVATVGKQILLVDPKTKAVAAVVNGN